MSAWLIDALLASTLLMAAVLIVRGAVRRAFGPQVAYALWALPVLRLLLPPLPAGWWQTAVAAPITRAGETVTVYFVTPAATGAAPAVASWTPGLALAAAWGLGAAAFLVWHLARHARFCRAVLRDATVLEERDGIRVIASAAAPGPLAFGIRRRFIAFPADVATRYDADEQALALAHELNHHARRDLAANWVALVVLALHWFSPLAWYAFRAFRADQELANDAGVLAACGAGARHAYGRAIVKAASPHLGTTLSAACHLHSVADLKGRLKMLTSSRASRRRLVAGSAAVTVLVAAGLGLTASSSAAERLSATLETPPAPAAPAAPVAMPAPVTQAPSTAPTPPAAPVPPAPSTRPRATKHVVVVRNGETRTYEGAEADRYIAEHNLPIPPLPPVPPVARTPGAAPVPPVMMMRRFSRDAEGGAWRVEVPQVSSGRCPGDARQPVVENRTENGRHIMIICNNRIERMTRDAQGQAAHAEVFARMATGNARMGLSMARAAIERDRNLSAEQRAHALAGIAQAEAELRDPANN